MPTKYESIDGRPALRFERRIGHPVDAVWSALTEPDQLKRWFPNLVAGEMKAGGRLKFTFVEQDLPAMEGEITAFDPPRSLAFYWGEDHLSFELEPVDGEARTGLRFTVLLDSADKAARDGAGWHVCLDGLEAGLDGADEQKIHGITAAWRRHYEEYAARGFPASAPIPGAVG
jgi:uncharacterized protein YndB with AHSA1/START domain